MAAAGRYRLLRLPRRADKRARLGGLPLPRRRPLEAFAPATPPKGPSDLGADHEAVGRLAPESEDPSPLARTALRRQIPAVGAVCSTAACPDLSAGRTAMWRSTGITKSQHILVVHTK